MARLYRDCKRAMDAVAGNAELRLAIRRLSHALPSLPADYGESALREVLKEAAPRFIKEPATREKILAAAEIALRHEEAHVELEDEGGHPHPKIIDNASDGRWVQAWLFVPYCDPRDV